MACFERMLLADDMDASRILERFLADTELLYSLEDGAASLCNAQINELVESNIIQSKTVVCSDCGQGDGRLCSDCGQ